MFYGASWCMCVRVKGVKNKQHFIKTKIIPSLKRGCGSVMVWHCYVLSGPGMTATYQKNAEGLSLETTKQRFKTHPVVHLQMA